jgi:hypothetical protein
MEFQQQQLDLVEQISNISAVNGFSGIITGITTTTGIGGNPLALKFILKFAIFCWIETGYPIYIFDTRVGNGVTSINNSDSASSWNWYYILR